MSLLSQTRIATGADEWQYRIIQAVIFPFFLVEAAGRRVWRVGRRTPLQASRSTLAEARAASANAALLAIQG